MDNEQLNIEDIEINFEGRPWVFQFTGTMNCGKDTCAKLLKELLEEKGLKVLCLNYADFLKAICTRNFGYDDSKKEEGRKILQDFGTLVKEKERDFWIHTVFHFFDLMRFDYDAFIIADCRYEEEMQPKPYTFTYPVINIYVNRDVDVNEEYLKHKSEELANKHDTSNFHWIVDNNGSLEETKSQLNDMYDFWTENKKQCMVMQMMTIKDLLEKASEVENEELQV